MSTEFSYPNSPDLKHDAPAAETAPSERPRADKPAAGGVPPQPQQQQGEQPPGDKPEVSFSAEEKVTKADAPDDVPEEIKKMREADEARKLFSPQVTYRDVIKTANDATDAEKAQDREWREVLADVGASEPEARSLFSTAQRELAAGVPSAETVSGWEKTARAELQQQYGPNAEEALKAAARFVARDPRLFHFLHVTGLGSHPAVVKIAVAKAYRRR